MFRTYSTVNHGLLQKWNMDIHKIDVFVMTNGCYIPEKRLALLRNQLKMLDDSRWGVISTIQFKNPTTALFLSILLGCYGIDRFYIGDIGLGLCKLFTLGGLGIWTIIDWFLISNSTRNRNYKKLSNYLR